MIGLGRYASEERLDYRVSFLLSLKTMERTGKPLKITNRQVNYNKKQLQHSNTNISTGDGPKL